VFTIFFAAAFDLAAFDLSCVGTQSVLGQGYSSSYQARLRIDLEAMRWCEGECAQARRIEQYNDDTLLLSPTLSVDRDSGVMTSVNPTGAAQRTYLMRAQCSTAPFSGFPGKRS
jgi:hypothetical protein